MTQKTSAFTKRFFSVFLAMVLSFILVVPVAYADSTSKSLTNAKKISVDETITLAVSGWNCSVEWESSDPGIATVTPQKGVFASKAVVKGIKPGTVKVTATATRVWDFWWQAHKVTSEFEITVKEQSYTVKFVTNGGTRVASQNVTQGQTVTRPEDPVKCGYVFNGWYEDSELLYEYDFSTPVNSDMTLFAGWKKVSKPETIEKQIKVGEKVTLTYSANICAAVWISSASDVAAVTSSSVGKKCEVTGIKAGTAFVTASPINIFSLIENKGTVIARYKIVVIEDEANENYTVTFESNGGSAVSSQNVKNGAAIVRPEDPIKEGFNFVGWYSDAALENEYDFASVVTSDITLYAKWEQNNTKYYTVNFALSVDELVDNASVFSPQQVSEGSLINKPVDPISSVFIFDGWYTSIEAIEKFDFNKPITKDVTVFAKWNIDKTDSDNDGLYDVIEYEINTDYNKADTDSDGLNDCIEKIIGTDPLKKDSDQNGVSDYDEDADSDGLTNGYEVSIGTNPADADTDCDGLNDSSEINDYETNPVKEDTDGDGANDSWEIINGYDPKVYNAKFNVTSSSEELTQYNHISASVKLNLDGNQAETLEIKRVSVSDNPLITPSIAGYLGCAYDFSVDGKFEQATITFNYDMDIFGAPNENFQPRIYYLNEETGLLEELKNQTVENGSVSTIVTHFSTYILLNKVEFDKIWENEIRLPDDTSTGITGLDIAIVIDSSGSMTSNDKTGIRLKAAKEFVDKLGENDRAAIIDFDNYATVYQGFTADHELLYAGIDKVDSSGGTSLSAGISKAINLFKDESYTRTDAYKYIVFLTDGDGSYSTSYTVTAAENGIVIYTIGLGSGVRESTLKAIAEGTGGKYYFASTATSLPNIYDDISFETIDYTTDSNNDGISDYYTELIYKGELPINNSVTEFKGVDFSISDDYDGDGLKNGQELVITYKDNNVYAVMKSDPRIKHSDSDGIDDYKEVKYSSDPLKYDVLKNATDALKNDGLYTYSLCVDEINNDWFQESMIWVNSLIYGVWNKDELYRDILIDYFFNYTKADYVEDIEFEESRKSMVGSLFEMIAGLVNTINGNL